MVRLVAEAKPEASAPELLGDGAGGVVTVGGACAVNRAENEAAPNPISIP